MEASPLGGVFILAYNEAMKKTLLLIFGGQSAEHEVSIRSAHNVLAALDKEKYEIVLCYIDKDGQWWYANEISQSPQDLQPLAPQLGRRSVLLGEREQQIDVLLPILHGPNGEDGSVQGLAQLMHVPIVGCGIIGSAVCMDKDVAKRLLSKAGIGVAKSLLHRQGEPTPSYDEARAALGDVLFVKPANLGSSVGVSKATNAEEFDAALHEAHKHDRKVLIEQAIVGRELECAVLGNDHPEASTVGEIMPGDTFYSYEDKYADDSQAVTKTTSDLPADVVERIRQTATQAFTALECRGLARVDFFLADDGALYINEINTMPGFTSISMYPQLWQASGLGYSELLDKMIALAVE